MAERGRRILLVEDNPGDARLAAEVLKAGVLQNLFVVEDGADALAFLRRQGEFEDAPRPDLILLDLNLPKKDGHEVLAAIKADERLKRIPVIVLTSSQDPDAVNKAYDLNANCYVTKPLDFESFEEVMRAVENFWLNIAELPKG